MRCPFCGFEDTKVIDSRSTELKKRRRRECTSCEKRFTTYEIVEMPLIMVEKKDGSFEPFDRNKLITGIYSAIKKRPVNVEEVSKIADEIESSNVKQITSVEIGNLVLERLKELDVVAYIRFASVYKNFADIGTFREELNKLSGGK
mgnify:FL=1